MIPVPDQVVVAEVFSTLPPVRSFVDVVPSAAPPFALIVPAPVIVPPLQVVRPDTLTMSGPWSVPEVIVSVAGETVSPLPKVTEPPPTVSALPIEVSVDAALKVTAAPAIVVSEEKA